MDTYTFPPAQFSAGPPASANRELLTAAKGIDYIQRKCVGTDTRRSNSSYNFRESPVMKAALSAQPNSARNVYLYQNRPSPMAPLKAWKGYSGNIYFDPIKINRVNSANGAIETVSRSQTGSAIPTNEVKKQRRQTAKPDLSSMMLHCDLPPKPAIIMDKDAVLDKHNRDIQEDLEWIRNSENVGSLKIERGPGDSRAKEKRFDHRLLHKGSVAHELARQKRKEALKSAKRFSVSGDRYVAPSYMSPLLRSSAQYSQSTHRPVTNSPDASRHSAKLDRLPPLEQLRASLRGSHSSAVQGQVSNRRVQIVSDDKVPSYVKLTRNVTSNFSMHAASAS